MRLYEQTSVMITTNLLCGAPHNRFNAESLVMRSPTIGSAEFPKTLLGKHSPLGTQHFA